MKRNVLFIVLITAVLALIASFFTSLSFYTDWLFFKEVGYEAVFRKSFLAKVFTGLAAGGIAALFLLINIFIANRQEFPQGRIYSIEKELYGLKKFDMNRLVKHLGLYLSVLAAVVAVIAAGGYWKEVLLFMGAQPAGLADPVFSRDVSFYLFRLPLIDSMNTFLSILLLTGIVFTALNYILRGGITYIEGLITIDRRVKRHLALLVSIWIVNLALKFYLDRYALLFNEHGVLYGASYTDINARLLMLNVLTGVSLATAVGFFIGVTRRSKYAAILPLAILGGVYFLGIGVYPSLLQNFKVSPNEIVLEKPYIEQHIKFTRYGYDLERIQTEPFDVSEKLTFTDINRNISTIRNIRLWDEKPLLKTYSQLQQIRTYYKFVDVDNDRYDIEGKYTQVMLSPRELSYEDLPGKSWINERLVFTHGVGLAMGPVSGITREGLPEFFIKDIPPVSTTNVKVTRPEIYYGEKPNDYVIVKTKVKEFSYPTTEGNVYTIYEGTGGIRLSSFIKRMLYATYFGNFKIFLSTDITSESRILYYRNIIERVNTIAPFLLYDSDPYMVVSEKGRLYWIIDAYTFTDRLPYSKPLQQGINYIRNPIKAVVDAYNGAVSFYIVDDKDIIANTYGKIFPTLFKPLSEMPDGLRKHVRYPRSLLRVQARMFSLFHMTDPRVFYNKEDLWEIPVYKGKSMEPYYIIMKLPAGQEEEFVLLLPFTPSKRDNLAAWMAARSDGDNYGKVIVYTFPRDRLVFGPRQVDARIDQNAYISQQLTLWGQSGSDVIRGSLLVIPIERSLIYVQPLYLVATDRVGLPELRRVIVAYGNKVVMEDNLEAALRKLFKGSLPELKIPERVVAELSQQELGRKALDSLEKAREALRKEDWSAFGEYLKKTEELLREFSKQSGR
ncbi:UPF0182 protein AF1421 [hydrothermal vent metagenome]|uniref:UPF0182 protein AF1421 n=1 Tax=hydrothermal vent metagenome TaxID=652676 RepID=A0A3B1CXM7_9ZZZZ